MTKRSVEINRKVAHALFGVLLVILLMFESIGALHILVLLIISIIISLLSKKYKIPVVSWLMLYFERDKNIKKFPAKGVVFYLIGVLFVIYFFPSDIARAAILILAFADSTSYLIGTTFGKTPHPFTKKKFFEGFIAGTIVGSLAATIFIPWHEALIASFFAMVAEGIEMKIGLEDVDDNLAMPITAAIVIWLMRILF